MPAKSPEALAHKKARTREREREVRAGTYVPRPPRGPAKKPHYIPEGHELAGVSRLKDASGDTVQEWDKTRVAGAEKPPVDVPPSFLLQKTSTMQRGDGSVAVQWSSYSPKEAERWEAIKQAVIEHVATYVLPAETVEAPVALRGDLLTCYPLGDPHIGMMAWAAEVGQNFDLKIAERELCECVLQLVDRAPPSYRAIVGNVGDFFHAQDNEQRTPKSGNKLDVDGRAGKVALVGFRILRTIIDTALRKHCVVDVRNVPGNHDPHASLWLPLLLGAAYENEPRVTIQPGNNPYQFDTFGKNLIGWCHGDGAKLDDLGEIMATDEPAKWGAASFRYWLTGHVHHDTEKELRGCVVNTFRTLAGPDAWHHHSGYRSGRSLKALTYHREYGLDSTTMVGVERVRAALNA